jgi:hypothetical protein
MSFLYTFLAKLTGTLLFLSGMVLFVHGLVSFAASKASSLEGFGAVLLGYGGAIIGIYVNPTFRQATEDGVAALRRIADRFFDV